MGVSLGDVIPRRKVALESFSNKKIAIAQKEILRRKVVKVEEE